jgi:hypothetical protein
MYYDAWTAEQIKAVVRKVIDEKKSASIAADELNAETGSHFTRNAVIGKLNRMNLHADETRIRKSTRPLPAAPDAVGLGLPFGAVEPLQCRWIEDHGVCGLPAYRGRASSSWCERHYRMAYQR